MSRSPWFNLFAAIALGVATWTSGSAVHAQGHCHVGHGGHFGHAHGSPGFAGGWNSGACNVGGWNAGVCNTGWNAGFNCGPRFTNTCFTPFNTYSWNTCYRPVGFSSFYCGAPTVGFGYYGGWGSSLSIRTSFYNPYWYGYDPYSAYLPAYGFYPTYFGGPVYYRPFAVRRPRKPLGLAEVTAAEIDRRVEEDRNRPYGLVDVDRTESAERFLAMGDASFREGKYAEALRRYRIAEDAAPRNGEVFRRKGHAYVANGQYKLAAVAFKRGFGLSPDLDRGGFTLKTLYGDDEASKATHIDRIAQAALKDLNNPDLYYVLGVSLRYDGQVDRATTFFARAYDKSRGGSPRATAHLALFAPRAQGAGVAALEAADSDDALVRVDAEEVTR